MTKQKEKIKNFMEKKKGTGAYESEQDNMLAGKFDLSKLTEREEKYFRLMFSSDSGGILYVEGGPGLGKSAILRGIAEKLNLFYIDLRLSQIDETDVGLYPDKVAYKVQYRGKNGEFKEERQENFLTHIIPEWAHLANNPTLVDESYIGTIINFEELNRAPVAVRNAALQLLVERQIGFRGFKFNKDVFMASTGNLGEEDDTDVDEFDSALNDRLFRVKHDMDLDEWVETWAQYNVHSAIISYLRVNPEEFYVKSDQEEKQKKNPTPRAWTFLSNAINKNFGKINPETREILEEAPLSNKVINFVNKVGSYMIGNHNAKLIKHLEDINKFTIWDVLGYSELAQEGYEQGFEKFSKQQVNSIDRSKRSELLEKFKRLDYEDLSEKQIENLKLFMLSLKQDEKASFFLRVVDEYYHLENESDKDNPIILSIVEDERFGDIVNELEDQLTTV